jgi:hypothetical protein
LQKVDAGQRVNPGDFEAITPQEVAAAIKEARKGKAAGSNGKNTVKILVRSLQQMCPTRTDSPGMEALLSQDIVQRKGRHKYPNNYRGITENNVFKIFSKILTKRLMEEVVVYIPEN